MRLVWHIVKKDLRRMRWPLALWSILLIAKGELGVFALAGDGNGETIYYLALAEKSLLVLDLIVNLLLVAALVQEDALVGTRVFWSTRPITGGRLFAAKLLGGGLMFGVLPMVVALRWWLVCGYTGAQMARAALVIGDTQLVIFISGLLLAVLTKNIKQFLAWLMGLAAIVVAGVVVMSLAAPWERLEITRGVSETQGVLLCAVFVIGGPWVILHQFLTRRTARSVGLAVVVGGLAVASVSVHWDFSNVWTRTYPASAWADGITIETKAAKLERPMVVECTLRGVPDIFDVRAGADHVWRWPNGETAAAQSELKPVAWPGWAEWHALGLPVENAFAPAYVAAGPDGAPKPDRIIINLPAYLSLENTARLLEEPAAYTGALHLVLLRPKLEFELPLRDGENRKQAGFGVRIVHSETRDGQWHLTLVQSRPAFGRAGMNRPGLLRFFDSDSEEKISPGFALVNRARGEAVKLWQRRSGKILVGTQEVAWIVLEYRRPLDRTGKKIDLPLALEGATLAVMREHEEARFDRTIAVGRFGGTAENGNSP